MYQDLLRNVAESVQKNYEWVHFAPPIVRLANPLLVSVVLFPAPFAVPLAVYLQPHHPLHHVLSPHHTWTTVSTSSFPAPFSIEFPPSRAHINSICIVTIVNDLLKLA